LSVASPASRQGHSTTLATSPRALAAVLQRRPWWRWAGRCGQDSSAATRSPRPRNLRAPGFAGDRVSPQWPCSSGPPRAGQVPPSARCSARGSGRNSTRPTPLSRARQACQRHASSRRCPPSSTVRRRLALGPDSSTSNPLARARSRCMVRITSTAGRHRLGYCRPVRRAARVWGGGGGPWTRPVRCCSQPVAGGFLICSPSAFPSDSPGRSPGPDDREPQEIAGRDRGRRSPPVAAAPARGLNGAVPPM